MTRYGIFDFINPPTPEVLELSIYAVDQVNYPWHRILPHLRTREEVAVEVLWTEQKQNVSGTFWSGPVDIQLDPERTTMRETGLVFTLAHEIGHLVDSATFGWEEEDSLRDLFHTGEYVQLGHYYHDHPDAGHVNEEWGGWKGNQNAYTSRLNECYADQFVAAFAPAVWNGEAEGTRQHHPRFVHWTSNHQAVRNITLRRDIVAFTDVPADGVHRKAIEWCADQGLVQGNPDGTFEPNESVSRAQLCSILYTQAKKEGKA